MNKLFKKIATLSVGLAMAIGVGVAVGSENKSVTNVNAATEYEELFSISSGSVISGTTYQAHTATVSTRGWVVTFGGNNSSVGTNSKNRSNCNLGSYSKYAVSPVATSSTASAFASTTSISDVAKISYTFNGGSNQTSTNVYVLYSSDNTTFSQLVLSSGTQGATISSGTAYEFAKSSGYFALLFQATNSSGNWRIDSVSITFYTEKAPSKTLSSIGLSGSYPTSFYVGDTFSHTGMVVTATYSDTTTAIVTTSATWSSPNMSTAGSKSVTVSYTEGTVTKTATYNILVNAPISVTGVMLNVSEASIIANNTTTLVATVLPADATNKNVTWSSSSPSVATVTSAGVVTGVAEGQSTITVTTVDGGFTATCVVTVSVIHVESVTLNTAQASIDVKGTTTLVATVLPADATNKNVTWSSSSTNVATVSNTGVVTGVAGGTSTITVTTVDGGFTATCVVTVNAHEDVTFLAGTDTGSASGTGQSGTITKTGVSFYCSSWKNDSGINYRLYSGSTITLSSTVGKIAKIQFIGNDSSYKITSMNLKSGSSGSLDKDATNNKVTWTGASDSISFEMTAQGRAQSVIITFESFAPSVELAEGSAESVTMMKENPADTSVKVLVKNIATLTWNFTFDEDNATGKTSSSYVSVTASSLVDNVSTLSITSIAVGSTTMHISVSGTTCATAIPITITQRPAAGTMVAKLSSEVVTDTVEVQTGAYKQFTFAAKDTDGNAYNIDAADVTGTKESGTATVTISGTRVTCDTKGTAVVRYKLNVLETVYVDISFNVIDDYLVSVNSVTFNTGLAATQGDSPAVAVFATRLGNTHFLSTADIPLEDFRFSYDDVMGAPSTQFGYDFNHGTTVDETHKLQTIYVYCTLGNVSCGSYSVLVEQKSDPLTAITISNVVDHKKDIARGSTFQLEIAFEPTNPTDGKGLVYRVDTTDEGVDINVDSTGLISVAASSEFGNARIIVKSDHNDDISDYVDVTVILESMTYTVRDNPSWHLVSDPSTLVAGDQVILTGIKGGVTYAAGLYGSGNNVPADTEHTLTVTGDTVTGVVSTMIYTLETGTAEGSLAFKGSDNKYLCAASSSKNYMYSTATLDANASFVLYDDGDVIAQGEYSRDHMRYNNNDTSNLFSCYSSSSTTGSVVTFYKLSGGDKQYTVTETLYLGVRDNFGNEGATYEWDASCSAFNSSNWLSACNALKGIDGYSTYELNRAYGDISGNEIEQFIAKYDIIIGKVGVTYDYLGRFSGDGINANQKIGSSINFLKNSNINTAAIVIIVSIASVAAIGGYFFIHRKKED